MIRRGSAWRLKILVSAVILSCIFLSAAPAAENQEYREQACPANDTTCQSSDHIGDKAKPSAEIVETINIEYGEPQVVLNIFSEATRQRLEQTQRYIMTHWNWKQTCQNRHHLCSYWAATDECTRNSQYMQLYCRPSCHECQVPDANPMEATRAALINASVMQNETAILVATAFGEAQYLPIVGADPIVQAIAQATRYMSQVYANVTLARVRSECKNKHQMCSYWKSQGECVKNSKYMAVQCAPACQTCEQITYEYRCPFDKDTPTALSHGDLDRLFERILTDLPHHTPTVLSRPPQGPWVLQFDTFVTLAECDRLIQYGQHLGYNTSVTASNQQRADGTVEGIVAGAVRTSTNAWCKGGCEKDPIVQPLWQRIEKLLDIPQNNSEYLQLLRYNEGQFYRQHHDYLPHHQHRPQGVRILTLFLYLNDVEGGGETRFTNLGIDVKAKKGRAVLWPSVLNEDPNVKDFRTDHEALTVTKGVKYGANAWVHQRDYITPHLANCA